MKMACSHSNTRFSVLVTPPKAEAESLLLIRDLSAYAKPKAENNAVQMV